MTLQQAMSLVNATKRVGQAIETIANDCHHADTLFPTQLNALSKATTELLNKEVHFT